MLSHLTVTPSNTVCDSAAPITAIVLVGPPACGKSTLRTLFEDAGTPSLDLDGAADTSDIESLANETATTDDTPTVACIEGAVNNSDIAAIRNVFDTTLVVRVRASPGQRLERCVKQLEATETVLSSTDIKAAHRSAIEQEVVESSYPMHDVSIRCTDDVDMAALADRCERIVDIFDADH